MLREVLGCREPAWERDRPGVAQGGRLVDDRAAGVGQAEQTRDLVVRLPRRIVDRRAQLAHAGCDVVDAQQRAVATGDEQRDRRARQRSVVEHVDGHVADEVVHPVQRLVQRDRQCLRGGDTHDERGDQAGAGRHGDPVDLAQVDLGVLAGARQRREHRLEVGAGSDLGDDAAEAGMQVDRGGDLVGEQLGAADDPHAGLVAARLDAEHERCGHEATSSGDSGEYERDSIGSSMTSAWRPGP